MLPEKITLDHDFVSILSEIQNDREMFIASYYQCKNCNVIICDIYYDQNKENYYYLMGKLIYSEDYFDFQFEHAKDLTNTSVLSCNENIIKNIIE